MSYEIELSTNAVEDFKSLDEFLKPHVVDQLIVLAEHPVAESRPAVSPPYPPGGQMREFEIADPVDSHLKHRFVILFLYGQDETTLYITGIGYRQWRTSE